MDNHLVSPPPTSLKHSTTTRSEQAFLALALAAVLLTLLHLYTDYKAFLALGPGGTPSTLPGYLRTKALSLFALRNPYLPTPTTEQGHLRHLPARLKPRPVTRGIAPHRQTTQCAPPALYQRLTAELHRLVVADPERLALGTSCFEKHGIGLFSRSPVRPTCGGEICHAHPSDGSMHMTLHPADAKVVLEAGWGEKHPLARGGWFEMFVPKGFIMVYAPGGEEEVEVLVRIVEAGAWFVDFGKKDGADLWSDITAEEDAYKFGKEGYYDDFAANQPATETAVRATKKCLMN